MLERENLMNIMNNISTIALAIAFIWVCLFSRAKVQEIHELECVKDSLNKEIVILEHSNIPDVMKQRLLEQGFFEGQKYAIEDRIIVFKAGDGKWYWRCSPHRDGTAPIFWPEFLGKDK